MFKDYSKYTKEELENMHNQAREEEVRKYINIILLEKATQMKE